MDRLTLSQARAALLALGAEAQAVDGILADPRASLTEALVDILHRNPVGIPRETIAKSIGVLRAFVAHLDFQEGRTFELAAVKKAIEGGIREEKGAAKAALVSLGLIVNSGLHHAEPAETPTPQMGDIWLGGRMLTEVRCVLDTGSIVVSDLYGNRAHMAMDAAEFTRNRRLVERDGKAVI